MKRVNLSSNNALTVLAIQRKIERLQTKRHAMTLIGRTNYLDIDHIDQVIDEHKQVLNKLINK